MDGWTDHSIKLSLVDQMLIGLHCTADSLNGNYHVQNFIHISFLTHVFSFKSDSLKRGERS